MSVANSLPSHVNTADMQAAARAGLPEIISAPSDSPQAFHQAAKIWLERWVNKHGDTIKTVTPFALVFEPPVGDDSSWSKAAEGWSPAYFFREDLPLQLSGSLMVTATAMNDVTAKTTTATSLRGIGEELVAAGLENRPCLIVNAVEGFVIVCQTGVQGERYQAQLDMSPIINLTQDLIDEELLRFHSEHTQFPTGFTHVFHDRKARILISAAEDVVRDNLFLHLQYRAFRSKFIIREHFNSAGRTDLTIVDSQQGNRVACVIELKVLRSRAMPRKPGPAGSGPRDYTPNLMMRHARMGVRQAQKYREIAQPMAQWAYICLFDGREQDEDLPEVQLAATNRGVIYRRYFMEESARDDLDV